MNPSYVAEVERAFLRAVGRGIMLSPRDLDLVERWDRAGLPVEVVLAGIERAFDGRPARPVRGLAYVVGAVEDAAKAWRARSVGGDRASSSTGLAPAFERIGAALEAAEGMLGGAIADTLRDTRRAVRQLADRSLAGLEADPAAALATLSDRLADRALAALDVDTRASMEAQVDAVLAAASGFEDPGALAEARRARSRRAVREALDLPALVLDLGGGRW